MLQYSDVEPCGIIHNKQASIIHGPGIPHRFPERVLHIEMKLGCCIPSLPIFLPVSLSASLSLPVDFRWLLLHYGPKWLGAGGYGDWRLIAPRP